jgi:hypothetical protein
VLLKLHKKISQGNEYWKNIPWGMNVGNNNWKATFSAFHTIQTDAYSLLHVTIFLKMLSLHYTIMSIVFCTKG